MQDSVEVGEAFERLFQKLEALEEQISESPRSDSADVLLTRDEAASHLRISTRTLDTMEAAGEISSVRIRGRVLYHRDALNEFIRARIQRKDSW